jgi:iron complex transport system substrate-binding protein
MRTTCDKRQQRRRCAAALAGLLLAAFVQAADARDRSVGIPEPLDTSRIVSIGGAVTEILYALGEERRIVGVDTTSLYPPAAQKEKPSVGYMRQLSAEGVLGLRPSLILAVEGSGPKETVAVLQAAGVPLVVVPESHTGEGIVEKIRIVSQAVGAQRRGECLIARVQADLAALRRIEAGIEKPMRVLFVLSFVNGRAMVGGSATAANGIIRIAGAVNSVTSYDGYKPVSAEAIIAAKPDVILAMDRAGPGTVNAETVFANPAFAATPAGSGRRFIAMDALYLLGFGPRTARAARDLAVKLYPDFTAAALPSESASAGSCPHEQ